MINEQQIKELTKQYLISYNYAMEETKNPTLAVQAACSVLNVIGLKIYQENQQKDAFKASFPGISLIMEAVNRQKEKQDSPPPEDEETEPQKEEKD